MPAQVTNYQCPNCTGPLHFVGASGKLECDFCGSQFDVKEIEQRMAEAEAKAAEAFDKEQERKEKAAAEAKAGGWDTTDLNSDWGADAANMRAYNCSSCGAELICDATTAATSCPYCGNNTIVPGQFAGTLKPDLVIPFKLDKNAAVRGLQKHYKGKFLLPKTFSKQNHVEEIKGVYVPFWLFDGKTDGDVKFHATRSHSHTEGDYEVTVTEHYQVRRAGTAEFRKVPVDGSSKMPDDLMDSIEPFNYEELKAFSTAYLPGFLADRYDVTAEESAQRADERCENSAVELLRETVTGYDTVTMTSKNVRLKRGKVRYALMPVWLLSTKWEGKNFLFAMNGQTGRMVGDLPMSWGKFWRTFFLIAVPVAAAMAAFLFL